MQQQTIIKDFGVLYRTFLDYISKSIEGTNLSFSDSVFLVNIGNQEGICQEEISATLAIDKAAIARSVKGMEQTGYVFTKRSTLDKRTKELYLTESGMEQYRDLVQLNSDWLNEVLADLTNEEIAVFSDTIHKISDNAKRKKSQ